MNRSTRILHDLFPASNGHLKITTTMTKPTKKFERRKKWKGKKELCIKINEANMFLAFSPLSNSFSWHIQKQHNPLNVNICKGLYKNSIGHVVICTMEQIIIIVFPFLLLFSFLVLPENPIILDRWGRIINRTTIGPMEEGDDVILSCRVVGGKYYWLYLHLRKFPFQWAKLPFSLKFPRLL